MKTFNEFIMEKKSYKKDELYKAIDRRSGYNL